MPNMEMLEEVWKEIPQYNGKYMISNKGRIWSNVYGRVIKQHLTKDGYCRISLRLSDGRQKKELVHRLVAITFIPNPDKLPQVNHIDQDKLNNCVENLEWCDSKYNNNYGDHTERIAQKNSVPVLQLTLDGQLVREWSSVSEAARHLNASIGNISECCCGKRNKHHGFKWQYKITL